MAEVSIHFQGLKKAHELPVLVFPELLVCFNCGKTEFTIPREELELLAKKNASKP